MNTNRTVKFERLLLENYLPIFVTTGLKLIEIDWSNTTEMLTLIVGANGSGKTVLLTEMTPDVNEGVMNRSAKGNIKIIPDHIGRKEVDLLVDNSYRYRCKMIQGADIPTKAFIEKETIADGTKVELNPNGNVSSYLDALQVELGFDRNYINIGYLTDGINSIIDMKPTERNSYISTWLPNIVDYINSHKIVSKNRNVLKRQLDMINADIARIASVDYTVELVNINSSIEDLEAQFDLISTQLTKGETFLTMLTPVSPRDIRQGISQLNSVSKMLKDEKAQLDFSHRSIALYSGPKGKERLLEDRSMKNMDLQRKKSQLQSLDEKLLSLRSRLQEYQSQASFGIIESLPDISEAINTIDNEMESLRTSAKRYEEDHPFFIQNASVETSQKVLQMLDSIRRYWLKIQNSVDIDILRGNSLELASSHIDRKLQIITTEEAQLISQRDTLARRLFTLKNSGIDPEILSRKPSHCTPSSCAIIKELMTLASPAQEIQKLEKEMDVVTTDIMKRMNERQEEEKKKMSIADVVKTLVEINQIIYEYRDSIATLPEELRNIINRDTNLIVSDFNMTSQTFNDYKEYSSIISTVLTYGERLDTLKNKEKLIQLKMRSDSESQKSLVEFEELMPKRTELIREIELIEKEIQEMYDIGNRAQSLQEDVCNYNAKATSALINKRALTKDATVWYYRSHLEDVTMKLRNDRSMIKSRLEESRIRKETIQSKMYTKESLEQRRDETIDKITMYELFEKIWSPKSGYPSLLIKDFLDEVKIRTNKDLQTMWGEAIVVDEFDMTDGEFAIKIIRNGTSRIPDASLCSDGERATLALAISLAILEIHVENSVYNVMRMDEVDAKLDDVRRRGFLSMITDRLREINCSTCVVVTHNNEFDIVPANLIIMPGFEAGAVNLGNKNIIFAVA